MEKKDANGFKHKTTTVGHTCNLGTKVITCDSGKEITVTKERYGNENSYSAKGTGKAYESLENLIKDN